MILRKTKACVCICLLLMVCSTMADSIENRKLFLKQLKDFVPKGIKTDPKRRVSPVDKYWKDW